MPRTEPTDLVERGRRVLALEAAAIHRVAERLSPAFAAAVQLLAAAKGRLIVSGVGKSGLIARKIAATFTSTGTPASFLHPVDSLHGDLGLVGRDDVALLLSKSGASDELFGLVGQLKRLGVPIIALTGYPDSVLARQCDVALDASVAEEACPETLAPTTSTTAALALGDALAVTLLEVKGFRREDFAALHPGGTLGRNLLLRVADVMLDRDVPTLSPERPMRECVVRLAEKRGTVAGVDGAGSLVGVGSARFRSRPSWFGRADPASSPPRSSRRPIRPSRCCSTWRTPGPPSASSVRTHWPTPPTSSPPRKPPSSGTSISRSSTSGEPSPRAS